MPRYSKIGNLQVIEIQNHLWTLHRKARRRKVMSPSLVCVLGLFLLGRHDLELHQCKHLHFKCQHLYLQKNPLLQNHKGDSYVTEKHCCHQAGLGRMTVLTDTMSKLWVCDRAVKGPPRGKHKTCVKMMLQLTHLSPSLSWPNQLSSGVMLRLQTASHFQLGLFPLPHISLLSYGGALRAVPAGRANWEDRELSHEQPRVKFFLNCLQSANIRDTSVTLSIQIVFYNVADRHV